MYVYVSLQVCVCCYVVYIDKYILYSRRGGGVSGRIAETPLPLRET